MKDRPTRKRTVARPRRMLLLGIAVGCVRISLPYRKVRSGYCGGSEIARATPPPVAIADMMRATRASAVSNGALGILLPEPRGENVELSR